MIKILTTASLLSSQFHQNRRTVLDCEEHLYLQNLKIISCQLLPFIFPPDQQTLNVTVTIRGDERIELEEMFEVTLRSVGDVGFLVSFTTRTTTVLIEDDDGSKSTHLLRESVTVQSNYSCVYTIRNLISILNHFNITALIISHCMFQPV